MQWVMVPVCALLGTACLPHSQPARPAQPVIAGTQADDATSGTPDGATTARAMTPPLGPANASASSATNRDPTLFAQPQPQPQGPQPQPYPQGPQPQPPPYPQGPQPQPYPQGPQPQPHPQPGQHPQPYPPQPYPQGPQPQPYPYPQPQPGQAYPPPPYPAPAPAPAPARRGHDGEVVLDFVVVGTLAATDIIIRQDVNGGTGSLIMLSGIFGGGALGWLLSERYPVDDGGARATSIGLLAGIANGALLIRPTEAYEAADVMALLFFGSAIGAGGGYLYGRSADLTSGQATFLGNAVLIGTATAALTGILGSQNGTYDNWENGTLALGLDAGLLAGVLVAPRLDWSSRRANTVLAATVIGALVGGMVPGLLTKRSEGEDYNGDLLAGAMTAGLWAGLGLGVVMTRDSSPDPRYRYPGAANTSKNARTTSYIPYVGDKGQIGLMAGGTW